MPNLDVVWFTNLLHGLTALMVAVAGLLAGAAGLLNELQKLKKQGDDTMSIATVLKTRKTRAGKTALLLLLVSFTVFAGRAFTREVSKNESLTTDAWKAYEAKNFDEAIRVAEECIDEFGGQATREEEDLKKKIEAKEESPPNTGKVSDEKEKQKILDRGVLNDVATCHYIKGRSKEALARIPEAKKAYEDAMKLSLGRCYDPKGWFWSPAQAAQDRLPGLKDKEGGTAR